MISKVLKMKNAEKQSKIRVMALAKEYALFAEMCGFLRICQDLLSGKFHDIKNKGLIYHELTLY
ncbi:hypothetical protein [Algoriphagus sp. CAU 1675]|uniref:hypothetical protein n=1 Tax=Algoriphagus sp. CAU 1675 TaxID=3032597 RepID=UPI0023DAB054|nr:hypothetical protein [Algoriphagus sp. CAU 1675]MDF2158025.1 hypothetical protein [Algoriphagus sp. CAU 1675]